MAYHEYRADFSAVYGNRLGYYTDPGVPQPIINRIGKVYGALLVHDRFIEKGVAQYRCECTCGNFVTVTTERLRAVDGEFRAINCGCGTRPMAFGTWPSQRSHADKRKG